MFKLWKNALESSLALLLDDAEANARTPDSVLMRVEEFSVTSQAVEHSFPALLVANGGENPDVLAEYIEDESETSRVGNQEQQLEQSPDRSEDEHFEFDMFEHLESSAPLGSLLIDTMIGQLNSE
uniref:Caf2 n=1 Tax=Arundo donax TaxID=35708 RepID=A0A0A8XP97_ARUDO